VGPKRGLDGGKPTAEKKAIRSGWKKPASAKKKHGLTPISEGLGGKKRSAEEENCAITKIVDTKMKLVSGCGRQGWE